MFENPLPDVLSMDKVQETLQGKSRGELEALAGNIGGIVGETLLQQLPYLTGEKKPLRYNRMDYEDSWIDIGPHDWSHDYQDSPN